jgi:hypothetical protein
VRTQTIGDSEKHLVTSQMSKCVVDDLEAVEVKEQQAESMRSVGFLQQCCDVLLHEPAVGQPGQRIMCGLMSLLLRRDRSRGDVARHARDVRWSSWFAREQRFEPLHRAVLVTHPKGDAFGARDLTRLGERRLNSQSVVDVDLWQQIIESVAASDTAGDRFVLVIGELDGSTVEIESETDEARNPMGVTKPAPLKFSNSPQLDEACDVAGHDCGAGSEMVGRANP